MWLDVRYWPSRDEFLVSVRSRPQKDGMVTIELPINTFDIINNYKGFSTTLRVT